MLSFEDIKGHKNFQSTACPGTNWEGVDDSLRNRIVNDVWQGYPDPQPTVTPPPQPPVDPTIPLLEEIRLLKLSNATLTQKVIELQNKIDQIKGIIQ